MSLTDFFKNIFSASTSSNTVKKEKTNPNKHYPKKGNDNTKSLRKGVLGEYKIDLYLEELPKNYKYISDILVVNSKSSTGYSQIDHIVITPYGIFVVETKNYEGEITGKRQDETWLVNRKFKMYNPFRQNYGHIQALKKIINNESIPFYSMISFTRRCIFKIDLELRKPASNDLIIYDTELSDYISRKILILTKAYEKPPFNDADILNIYQILKDANIEDKNIRQLHIEKAKQGKESKKASNNCATCGKAVSEKVAKFCLGNKSKYKGKVYCMEHQ